MFAFLDSLNGNGLSTVGYFRHLEQKYFPGEPVLFRHVKGDPTCGITQVTSDTSSGLARLEAYLVIAVLKDKLMIPVEPHGKSHLNGCILQVGQFEVQHCIAVSLKDICALPAEANFDFIKGIVVVVFHLGMGTFGKENCQKKAQKHELFKSHNRMI
jgi:hypothetical protein